MRGPEHDSHSLNLPEGNEYTHRAHRFPGKFHPPLIRQVVQNHPECNVLADPMCGSGTTGVEAAVAGKDGLCIDIDPLSVLMTRAKTHPVHPEDLREVGDQVLEGVDDFPEQGAFSEHEVEKRVNRVIDDTRFTVPYNLLHWFEPYVALGFARLLRSSEEVLSSKISTAMEDAILTSLAAMIREISRADPDPVSGLEVTSVRKKQLEEGIDFDVGNSFKNKINRIARGYKELPNINDLGFIEVVKADAREFSDVCDQHSYEPSLVITSPPYCNAIEYSRRHRLECEWLSLFDEDNVDSQRQARINSSREFIGSVTPLQETLESLPKAPNEEIEDTLSKVADKGKERKANLLRKYFLDCEVWIREVHDVLPDNGQLFVIVGPSVSYGVNINTPGFIRNIAESIGFDTVEALNYELKNNKMQFPTQGNRNGKPTESLLRLNK